MRVVALRRTRLWLLGLALAWLLGCGSGQQDEDCSQSQFCAESGWCTFDGNTCVVASDADCRQSKKCSQYGECTFNGESSSRAMCIATSDEDCANSQICIDHGACTLYKGKDGQLDGICVIKGK